jgi:hypothetical protein
MRDWQLLRELNRLEGGRSLLYEVLAYLETTKCLQDVNDRCKWIVDLIETNIESLTHFDDALGSCLIQILRQTQSIVIYDYLMTYVASGSALFAELCEMKYLTQEIKSEELTGLELIQIGVEQGFDVSALVEKEGGVDLVLHQVKWDNFLTLHWFLKLNGKKEYAERIKFC